ncbi:hypothetical protein EVU97_06585 [Dermacoccus sp. 147Ba]|uniref:LpqB family beta-propeller domain-containing protein n=1 Tax=Dermacoccus sp. 147Ba TaxID=2510111 RepID=UPI00101DFEFB|nr:LpqB family beta-propeller domain-containing protein [Dermacoccus sp. 147Ba]RYI22659.1 hypothetical protein EVU97_06585 [Dermacoccus sp. 147Ba]
MSRLSRPARLSALTLAAVITLSGCIGLPSTTGVRAGQAVDAGAVDEPLAVEPLTASSFDDPRSIATGFVRAQMSSQDNHAAARTFLTAEASTAWKPGSAVTVFSGESDIVATRPETGKVRLRIPVVATISPDGHLERSDQYERTLEFSVRETSAGWRLTDLPPNLGVWMSDSDVTRLFTNANVYYPARHGRVLIADPRVLPRQGLATALARASLSAPPAWLEPAVEQSAPDGTRLAVDAVPVREGTAQVDLSKQASGADNAQRTALWAAMTATLLQAPEVGTLNLTVGATRLEAENLPSTVDEVSDVGYRLPTGGVDTVISRSGTYLAWTQASANDAVSGTTKAAARGRPSLPAVEANWTFLAAGQGGRQIAAVSKDRTSIRRWVNGSAVTLDSLGTDLVRPAFDASGWLWTAGHAFSNAESGRSDSKVRDASVWAVDTSASEAGAAPVRLQVPWLGEGEVESLSMSPEGQRLAMIVKDPKGRRAVLAAVERDAKGRPVRLGPAHVAARGVKNPTSIVWADATSLAVLGTIDGTKRPALQTIDDVVEPLAVVRHGDGLASTLRGSDGLFVRTSNQTVFTRLGSSWSSFLSRGDVIVPNP